MNIKKNCACTMHLAHSSTDLAARYDIRQQHRCKYFSSLSWDRYTTPVKIGTERVMRKNDESSNISYLPLRTNTICSHGETSHHSASPSCTGSLQENDVRGAALLFLLAALLYSRHFVCLCCCSSASFTSGNSLRISNRSCMDDIILVRIRSTEPLIYMKAKLKLSRSIKYFQNHVSF
jgi:hypothetical protein